MSIGKMKLFKKFFQTFDVKKGNFNKPTPVEIFKIHKDLLSCALCLVRMRCQIPFTVFLRSDDLKRLIVPEHGKDDVADLVHHSSDSHVFLLCFAFIGIIAVDDRIYRYPAALVHLKVIERHHMQDASGEA